MRLVATELLKIWTAPRTPLILVFSMLALAGLGAAGISNEASTGFLESPEADIVDVSGIGTFLALVLGILIVTWEYRHGTIVQTFLAEPRRERVMAAKLVVGVIVGMALVALALIVAVAVAEIWLGSEFELDSENWRHVGRMLVASALWAVIGLGLGAVLQTQVGALMTALIWFLVVENILAGLGSWIWDVGGYLPGQLLDAYSAAAEPDDPDRLTAGLLGALYAAGFAAAGVLAVLRRDVT